MEKKAYLCNMGTGQFGTGQFGTKRKKDMDFYGRRGEIERLQDIMQLSYEHAQFTVITGRRRIGKTRLVLKAYEGVPMLYFFVARKAENVLCDEYVAMIEDVLGLHVHGRIETFAEVFSLLMDEASRQHITLFIDEFQEFSRINSSIYSDMQRIWDLNKDKAHINLLVCGSVNSLMNDIFRDSKEPLYGRQTQFMHVKAFKPSVLCEILGNYHPKYTAEDLLALYSFTGGVAKYVEYFIDNKKYTRKSMIDFMLREDSLFIGEGKAMLIEEFGKEYGVYFTILSLIAEGTNTRAALNDILRRELSGYLTRLDDDYGLISKRQPLFELSANKNLRYQLDDNFLLFWFRFIYKYHYLIEIGSFGKLREVVERDYPVVSGFMLERYFREKLIATQQFTRIGSWWDRKGENEIDLIAIDDLSHTATFYEIKRKASKIALTLLERKKDIFLSSTHELKGYTITCQALSMEDM